MNDKRPVEPASVPMTLAGPPQRGREYRIFLVAGETSGDALGEKLMVALNATARGRVRYLGVGGEGMQRQGLNSQFPLHEVAVMGVLSIIKRLPTLIGRVHDTVSAALAADPDVVVIIDAPEFTHPIAKRIRRKRPDIPIVNYVSPSVWAWRPGRAKRMRRYVDHVLALLPFEPDAHGRLGGPMCTYVGHPLYERMAAMRATDPAPLVRELGLDPAKPVLTVLPGSRPTEVSRLMEPFGGAVRWLIDNGTVPEVIIPVAPHVRTLIESKIASWPVKPHLIEGEDARLQAFRISVAALAASGTVTLELGVCGVPAVVAYKVDPVMAPILRRALKLPSVVLTNLVAGHNIYPEFHQEDCTAEKLAGALQPLFFETPERAAQLAGLAEIPMRLTPPHASPSEAAASIILRYAEAGRG
jgi:lipid-A-disaccharide synthase